jgi:hypothetical protein
MSRRGDGADPAEALAFLTPYARPDSFGRIGHYEVLEVLGRGGFGIVLRAFDEVLQGVVAVCPRNRVGANNTRTTEGP